MAKEITTKAIRLDSGRIVVERPVTGNISEVVVIGGGEMTNEEWEQYCAYLVESKRKPPFPR